MKELNLIWLQAIALAWKDPAFKQKLLEDPRLALKTFLGMDVPEDVELQVREGSLEREQVESLRTTEGKRLDIVLPPPPEDRTLEVAALADYSKVVIAGATCGVTQICCVA